jgi:hypothetical protein
MIVLAKLASTLALAGILVAGLTARPPRMPVTPRELISLVLAVVALYLVGAGALFAHRTGLAAVVFAAGLTLAALAIWLSRGGTPPRPAEDGREPEVEPPPPAPFDWSFYEQQLRDQGRPEEVQRAARSSSRA